jgi:23S rRNA U2552 (ribose-2'-O)-methylase RlmE/FtsJ
MKRFKNNTGDTTSDSDSDIKVPNISNEWSNKFVFRLDNTDVLEFNPDKIKYNDSPSRTSQSLVDTEKYKHLVNNKNQIDEFKIRDKMYLWNKWSKIVNPYEKIGNFSKVDVTISRAFFKVYEIIYYFNIHKLDVKNSLHICEAPGGFISASKYIFPDLEWHAQTLYEGGGSLKIDSGLDESRWILNGDGNIYYLKNILELRDKLYPIGLRDLITGDGGFDVSHNPNNQEQLSLKLIYAEMLTALNCQNKGGTFICKIFDSVTRPTQQILLILNNYYTSVNLIKPRTSRYTNSEKYIVALGFKGICSAELDKFNSILENWDNVPYCRDFGVETSKFNFKNIQAYNTFISINQAWYIHQAVQHSKINNKTVSNNLETMQNKRALIFCLAFDLKSDETMCEHKNLNKITGKCNIKYLFKCQNCLQLLVKIDK